MVEFYFILDLLILDRPLLFQAGKCILDHYETKFGFLRSTGKVVGGEEGWGVEIDSTLVVQNSGDNE